MEATPGFEPGIKVLQTSALPLGYVAVCLPETNLSFPAILARVAGFEPAHDGIRIHCLTAWRYPNVMTLKMGWIVGFEPTHNGATTRCLNHLTIPTMITCIRDISIPDQVIFGDPDRDRTDDLQRDRLAF